MRLLAITAVLIGAIIIYATFMFFHTGELSGELLSDLHLIEQKVKDEQWKEATREVEKLKKSWHKAEAWWTPSMDHRETELIDMSIVRVAGWVDMRSKEDALVEINVAKRMVQGIKEKESPSLKNIF
ncbi:MAG: DUF4363 family protein [Firmicutes bacterium]|nr:DUF4363 family protein [Bacillota bacterium]